MIKLNIKGHFRSIRNFATGDEVGFVIDIIKEMIYGATSFVGNTVNAFFNMIGWCVENKELVVDGMRASIIIFFGLLIIKTIWGFL